MEQAHCLRIDLKFAYAIRFDPLPQDLRPLTAEVRSYLGSGQMLCCAADYEGLPFTIC